MSKRFMDSTTDEIDDSSTNSNQSSSSNSSASSSGTSSSGSTSEPSSTSTSESSSGSTSESQPLTTTEAEPTTTESEPATALESEVEPSFSIDESLFSNGIIFENENTGEEGTDNVPPPSIIADGLNKELETVENELQINDLNDPVVAEKEYTTTEILDSFGDQDTLALDLGSSDQLEESDTVESSWSGHGQTQQLLTDQIQKPEQEDVPDVPVSDASLDSDQDQLTDNQDLGDTTGLDNVVQDQPPLTEQELVEQEQLGLEFPKTIPDMTETQYDETVGGAYSQEKFEQLKSDYQTSLEQRAALEAAQQSKEQHEQDNDQQISTTREEVTKEEDEYLDSRFTQQEELEVKPSVSDQIDQQNLSESEIKSIDLTDLTHQDEQTESFDQNESIIEAGSHISDEQILDVQTPAIDDEKTYFIEPEEQSVVPDPESTLDSTIQADVSEDENIETTSVCTPSEEDSTSSQALSPSFQISEREFQQDSFSTNYAPSYFSVQETISTRLFSELALLESTLESSDNSTRVAGIDSSEESYQSQIPSTDPADRFPTNLFQDLEPEFSDIKEYLASLDTPRSLEKFHDQIQQEADQVLLINDTHSLPDLDESLELVSQGPTIPEPPPYDFMEDLKAQEEANRQSFSTRDFLLRSLKQARLRQEVASYNFALQKIQPLQHQPNRDLQETDFQQSPSSPSKLTAKDNQQITTPSSNDKQRMEPQKTLEQYFIPHRVNLAQDHDRRNVISSERGIWGHLALHIPLLSKAGTDEFLDSLIQTRQQKHEIATAIVDKSWSTVRKRMLHYAEQKNIVLDPQILDTIIDWSKNELSIKLDRHQGGKKWLITRSSTQQENIENLMTEITFKPKGWHEERFKEIKTINISQIEPQISFDEWLFQRYSPWIQRVLNSDFLEERKNFLLLQYSLITEYDNNEEMLFIMGNDIFPPGTELHNRQSVYLKLINEETNSKDIKYKDLIPYESVEARVRLKSHWDSKEITGSLKTHVRVDLIDKLRLNPSEKDIEELIGQERILEGIITLNSAYREGDSIFIRRQVRTDDLKEIPENVLNQFGKSDPSEFRQPDFVILGYKDREIPKINIVLIDVKISETEFKTNDDGYGRGQPFRDGRWFLYMLKGRINEYFPDVKEEDIEVSYYILTAEIDKDNTLVFKGEELIRDVPAPYVYPNTGIIIKNDKDVYKLIEHIRYSYMADSEKSKNNKH